MLLYCFAKNQTFSESELLIMKTPEAGGPLQWPVVNRKSLVFWKPQFIFYLLELSTFNFNYDFASVLFRKKSTFLRIWIVELIMKTPEAGSPPAAMARKSVVSWEHQFIFYLLKLLTLINFNFDLGLVEMDCPPLLLQQWPEKFSILENPNTYFTPAFVKLTSGFRGILKVPKSIHFFIFTLSFLLELFPIFQLNWTVQKNCFRTFFLWQDMSHSQMLGKVEYGLPAKIWRLVGCTEMLSW